MTITLRSLLKAADFPSKEADDLMAKEEYLTDEEKFHLAETAWRLLSQKYFGLLSFEKMQILEEVKQGKRKHNPNDFEEIKAKLLHEFAQKLESAETEESVEEVREQLEKYLPAQATSDVAQAGKTKPLVQDKKDFAP